MVSQDNSRFFSLRNGSAVIQGVRFAAAFFGKGQFVPASMSRAGGSYIFRQALDAPYYQPLAPPQPVNWQNWASLRERRRRTQICRLEQTATVTGRENGFQLRIRSQGTDGVPLAIEIGFREGGRIEGCRPALHTADAWLLERDFGVYRSGRDAIRFGPGSAPHLNTQLRGAEPKLAGQSVYITGYTPFDHTLEFELL